MMYVFRSLLWALVLVQLAGVWGASNSGGNSLKFVLLGDWGKGGIYGDVLAPTVTPTVSPTLHLTSGPTTPTVSSTASVAVAALVGRTTTSQSKSEYDSTTVSLRRLDKNKDDNNGGGGGGGGGGGSITYTYQVAVSKALGNWASANSPDFVIALGDNFYTDGVASTSDEMWSTHWKQVYLGYSNLNIPWYPVLGNHDYGGGSSYVQAQLDYAKIDSTWQMNGKNYSQYFSIPDGGTVAIIFIDTTTLAPSVNKCCNSKGGISEEVQLERINSQLKNVEKMLKEAIAKDATWIFIAGHCPVYSAGPNGDISELQSYLQPLIQKYGVAAYFSGHDHISQHLQHNGIDYFISGAGCMTDGMGSGSNADKVVWSGTGYSAFASVSMNSDYMTIDYTRWDGEVVYSFVKARPSRPPSTAPTSIPSAMPSATPSSIPTSLPSSNPTNFPTLSPTTEVELLLFHYRKTVDKMTNEWLAVTCGVGAMLLFAFVYCITSCRLQAKNAARFEKLTDDSEQSKDVEANLDNSTCSVDESKRWNIAIPQQNAGIRERKKRVEDCTTVAESLDSADHVSISLSDSENNLDSSGRNLL